MTKQYGAIIALLGAPALSLALGVGQPATSRTRAHVETLASDRLEGRLAGSNGERLASDYIVSELRRIGVKPLPGRTDYLLPFEFTAGTRDGGSSVMITRGPGRTFTAPTDVKALSFSDNGEASGPLVFAGYGLVVPEGQSVGSSSSPGTGTGYDSYAGLDVKDKIVLVLRYFPEDADQKTRATLARYADLRYKAMAARQRGAKALLVVAGPRSPNAGETIPMSFDTALAGSGIVAVSIGAEVAKAIFSAIPHTTLEAAQQALDSGNQHIPGFAVPDITVTVRSNVVREKQTARNIAGYLPATVPPSSVEKPWVALGAHYDHLGRGDHGNSLAGKDEIGRVHSGADDNASGAAAVLAIGDVLAGQPRRRNVMLTFWSGEEIGLIGSSNFVANSPIGANEFEAYLNLDMVGRMQDNKLIIQAMGTSPAWAKIIEQANVVAGFDLQLQQDPYQPTDVASFNQAGVPCLNFFTGTHADYHRPSDTADKIDYEDLDRIVDFAATVTRKLEELDPPPQYTKVDRPTGIGGGRAGVRVFTGTIPDYATEVKGLLLSGVIGGGPAEQAGLQKGDIIVEIDGQSITNIYDYTYALELLKVGRAAKVVYLRNGIRKDTTLTPAARK